jgi:hypothetical protein
LEQVRESNFAQNNGRVSAATVFVFVRYYVVHASVQALLASNGFEWDYWKRRIQISQKSKPVAFGRDVQDKAGFQRF